MKYFFVLVCVFSMNLLMSQTTYKKTVGKSIPLAGEAVMSNEVNPFWATATPLVMPSPISSESKKMVASRKKQTELLHPRQVVVRKRSALEGPEVLNTFSANNFMASTPLDNHLAYSNNQVVSVVNTHFVVTNNTGFWMANRELNAFFASIMTTANVAFDPRIMYDPVMDRWIMTMMSGFGCADTQILFAFSQTNDATKGWNLYQLDGCPFEDMTFADYPMISLVGEELFFTYNGVRVGEPWQTGFEETLIWQIDKMSGYNGETLNTTLWSDLQTNGRNIRNLCPVKNATDQLPEQAYFLSNRNFDIENDTIFIVEVCGKIGDPLATLKIDIRKSAQPYGLAPNALQPVDSLQTNDSRVLDAFLLDDHIQFVSNCIDFESGKPAVYHGRIDDIFGNKIVDGNIIGGDDEYGYPGIVHVGLENGEHDVIIAASHASETRFPGFSVLYSDGFDDYSPWVTIKEGDREIDMQSTNSLERWGDYCGIQRDYENPDQVFVAASYGRFNRRNNTRVGHLLRPGVNTSTKSEPSIIESFKTYPNPADEWVEIELKLDENVALSIDLLDLQGKYLDQIMRKQVISSANHLIQFNTHSLSPGNYLISVRAGNKEVLVKQIIVAR